MWIDIPEDGGLWEKWRGWQQQEMGMMSVKDGEAQRSTEQLSSQEDGKSQQWGSPDRNRLSMRGSAYQWCCANPCQKVGKGYQGIPTLLRSGQLPPHSWRFALDDLQRVPSNSQLFSDSINFHLSVLNVLQLVLHMSSVGTWRMTE